MNENLNKIYQIISFRRKFSIYLFVFLSIICVGIGLYKAQIWPFGRGYFEALISAKKVYVTAVDEEARNHPSTALHKLTITRFKEIEQGHIAILSSNDTEVKFLHLSLGPPSYLSIGTYNIVDNLISIKKLGVINDSARANDIFVAKNNRIYASYVAIDKKTCASVKVVEIELDYKSKFQVTPFYQSVCTLPPYGLHESGGIFAEDNMENIYLTVGEFQKGYLVPDKNNDFGKILVKEKNANKFSIYSVGHRNPQGLYWDNDTKQLIETEHGPQGGDEINIIENGKNYGWPFVTYGTPYGQDTEGELFANKGTAQYGSHENYTKPIYAFVPSVGIKAITKMPNTAFEFPNWSNNYLIASAKTFLRVVIEDNRVILSEPIAELAGLRDIKITDGGIIIGSGWEGLVIVRRNKESRG